MVRKHLLVSCLSFSKTSFGHWFWWYNPRSWLTHLPMASCYSSARHDVQNLPTASTKQGSDVQERKIDKEKEEWERERRRERERERERCRADRIHHWWVLLVPGNIRLGRGCDNPRHHNQWKWTGIYYRKRGSASYIVREWLLWEGERERERERDACDVIRYHAEIASDHAYDYLDGASTQRVDAFWACRVFMH